MSSSRKPGLSHDSYAALRIAPFRRLLLAGVFTRVVTAGQSLAIGWEMYKRTNEPLALGLVGLMEALPMLLFSLPAGYLADVLDRRKIIASGMLGTTLTSIALAGLSFWHGPTWAMYVVLFMDSLLLNLAGPARQALLPLLVPGDKLENAVKWNSSLGQISGLVGPALGGLVIWLWLPAAYLLSAAGTAVFLLVLLGLPIGQAPQSRPGNMLRQVIEGIAFVWRQRILLGALSLDLFAVLLGGATYLLPIYVGGIIDLGPTGISPKLALGLLRSAPAAGAMTMALLLAHRPPFRRAGRSMFLAVVGFGLATIAFGLSRNLWLSLAMLLLAGAFDNISVVVRHTLVMLVTPNEMRGRVASVNTIFIGSSNQLGGFESGTVAQAFGPVASVVSGGIGTILVVAVWAGLFPDLRKFGSLVDAAASPQPAIAAGTAYPSIGPRAVSLPGRSASQESGGLSSP